MRILNADHIKDFELNILFSNGETKRVDFKELINPSKILSKDLLDIEYFKKFYLDEITICWPNGLDFSPNFLYEKGTNLKKSPIKNRAKRKSQPTHLD